MGVWTGDRQGGVMFFLNLPGPRGPGRLQRGLVCYRGAGFVTAGGGFVTAGDGLVVKQWDRRFLPLLPKGPKTRLD